MNELIAHLREAADTLEREGRLIQALLAAAKSVRDEFGKIPKGKKQSAELSVAVKELENVLDKIEAANA